MRFSSKARTSGLNERTLNSIVACSGITLAAWPAFRRPPPPPPPPPSSLTSPPTHSPRPPFRRAPCARPPLSRTPPRRGRAPWGGVPPHGVGGGGRVCG